MADAYSPEWLAERRAERRKSEPQNCLSRDAGHGFCEPGSDLCANCKTIIASRAMDIADDIDARAYRKFYAEIASGR